MTTPDPVDTTDPRVSAAARALGITMVLRAWVQDGVLHIQTPFATIEVPAAGYGKTDTLARGLQQPASPGSARPPTGASDPPTASPPTHDAGPEAPPDQHDPAGLDDLTAIPGVGPVTAEKLHNLGLHTIEDLRVYLWRRNDIPGVTRHTVRQIKGWLNQHLV
jgi:predicted flap endonuclease-1-like 5' DNA nuclease